MDHQSFIPKEYLFRKGKSTQTYSKTSRIFQNFESFITSTTATATATAIASATHFPIQTDQHLLHYRPGVVLINYKEQTDLIINIVVPRDENIQNKKLEKIENYQSLNIELEQLCKVKIMVIPVIVGAIGAIALERLR